MLKVIVTLTFDLMTSTPRHDGRTDEMTHRHMQGKIPPISNGGVTNV